MLKIKLVVNDYQNPPPNPPFYTQLVQFIIFISKFGTNTIWVDIQKGI